jgi:hypothetical protein
MAHYWRIAQVKRHLYYQYLCFITYYLQQTHHLCAQLTSVSGVTLCPWSLPCSPTILLCDHGSAMDSTAKRKGVRR